MLSEPLLIMTWLWSQNPPMHGYNAAKVNLWAGQLRRHLTIPYRLGCVTDMPEGLDSDIEAIPLPRDFDHVRVATWNEKHKLPQCYRRLTLFAPDAEKRFGARRFVSMDLDVLAFANLDSLFALDHELVILKGTAAHRPYNGGMLMMNAGARPQVFTRFTPEGAAESRRKFVGSDQAWISHVLGYGEKTWGPREGVYYKRLLSNSTWAPPRNMRLLFFPGSPKPWDIQDSVPFVKAAYQGKPIQHKKAMLYAYNDPKHWGKWFLLAAKKKGVSCRLFDAALPQGEPVFVRLDQQGPQRAISLSILKRLNDQGCPTLPTAQEGRWYDDKIAQHPALKPWMPQTRIIRSLEEARKIAPTLSYPLMSKASEGAGSANVRLLKSVDDALAEANRAFGHGLPISYKRLQKRYVYWQDVVRNNPCDYRICVVGEYLYGLKRHNRPGTLMASGSGKFDPLTFKDEHSRKSALLAVEITRALKTRWMCYDIVFEDEKPLVLEMSSAWSMDAYKGCRMVTHDLSPTSLHGLDSFGVAVDLLLQMGRQSVAA